MRRVLFPTRRPGRKGRCNFTAETSRENEKTGHCRSDEWVEINECWWVRRRWKHSGELELESSTVFEVNSGSCSAGHNERWIFYVSYHFPFSFGSCDIFWVWRLWCNILYYSMEEQEIDFIDIPLVISPRENVSPHLVVMGLSVSRSFLFECILFNSILSKYRNRILYIIRYSSHQVLTVCFTSYLKITTPFFSSPLRAINSTSPIPYKVGVFSEIRLTDSVVKRSKKTGEGQLSSPW